MLKLIIAAGMIYMPMGINDHKGLVRDLTDCPLISPNPCPVSISIALSAPTINSKNTFSGLVKR
ncbi:MAG: hypothetical protein IKG67_11580 [Parasporobacterium sp.]|nr:hypothetical protein [Parasporobacterium sp.]